MVLLLTGCQGDSETAPSSPSSAAAVWPAEAVARVGTQFITRTQVEEELQRRPPGATSTDPRTKALDALIERQVILHRARESQLASDPEVAAAIDQLLIAEYLKRNPPAEGPAIDDATVADYYDHHREDFTEPRAIRLGVIVLGSNDDAIAAIREQAEQSDEPGFKQLVARHSLDQATRYRGGDAGWIRANDRHPRWPASVMAAAWELAQPGQVTLVEVEGRTHLIRLLADQPERIKPLAEAGEAIRHTLAGQSARQRQEEFFQALRQEVPVEVNQAALDSVTVPRIAANASAPPSQPR